MSVLRINQNPYNEFISSGSTTKKKWTKKKARRERKGWKRKGERRGGKGRNKKRMGGGWGGRE